ncbi:MAG: DinB family protein [Ignavibacteriales bacterium]|nr:DinB family protein [Ignavibacteriales bacterium]
MQNHFINLFQYNDWANEKIFSALAAIQSPPEKISELLSHIILSQETWLGRVRGSYDNVFWKSLSLEVLQQRSNKSTNDWLALLNNPAENDLEKEYEYHNTKGIEAVSKLKDIITHLINHSTYHRAQINSLLRQNSLEPVQTDYIFYKRKLVSR